MPPLIRLARTHPDDQYRRTLGEFVRELIARADAETVPLSPESAPLRDAALLW